MYVKYTYLKLSCLLLGFIHYTCGQGTIGTTDTCLGQLKVRAGSKYTDNLSCPRTDNVLQCFSRKELCNNKFLCEGGYDEGLNIGQLDCDGSISGSDGPTFVCQPGLFVSIDLLCDGNTDCSNGDDETIPICANKCLVPYYGGCPYTRECISSVFDVDCGACLDGFKPDPANPEGDCLRLIHYTCGQGTIGTTDPCLGQLTVRAGSQFTDNLSCPRIDRVLQCYSREDLCDGNVTCTGGTDEGDDLVALDCDGSLSGRGVPTFVCTPDENIDLDAICDGIRDCTNGDDETTTLCENKCLVPYYGGCPYTRECISSLFDVNCGSCLVGFVPDPVNPGGECLPIIVFVTLQQSVYTVSEGNSLQVCAEVTNPANVSAGEVLTATLEAIPVSATPITDFINTTPVDFQFTPTQLINCVDIPISDDFITEVDETFLVSLSTNNSRIQFSPTVAADVIIEDNDRISFELLVDDISETTGPVQACVYLGFISLEPLRDVQVDIQTVYTGSAIAGGVDYTEVTTTLTFTSGAVQGDLMCINIPITDDLLVENTESFQVTVNATDPNVVFHPTSGSATVNIEDDDIVDVCLQQPTINTVSEDVGSHRECVVITSPPGRLAKNVTLLLITNNGSNVEANAQGNQMITFTPTNQDDTLCVDIPIIDDATCGENNELFSVHLMSNDSSVSVDATLCTGVVVIGDNDGICGLSTGVVVAITAVICSLFCFIAGFVCGGIIFCIFMRKKQEQGPAVVTQNPGASARITPSPNISESSVSSAQPVYEVISNRGDSPSQETEVIELQGNVAYGPFRRNQQSNGIVQI